MVLFERVFVFMDLAFVYQEGEMFCFCLVPEEIEERRRICSVLET